MDDDQNDRTLVESALRFNGVTCPIMSACDGLEAISYLMGERRFSNRREFPYPTFIVLDLKMPRADGFEVLRHLKRNPAFAITPTVVLSASQDADDIKKAYMLGASCYHLKPASFDELQSQLKILHDYWRTCRLPARDETGRQTQTDSTGKLGERFLQPPDNEPQKRASS